MSVPLKAWIQAALKAAEIIGTARNRREGLAAASAELGISAVMIRRQADLLAYVRRHARLEDVQAAQTKLEVFRSVERADPVRGNTLRDDVIADRLTLREIQMELDEAKIRQGLRKPVPLEIGDVLDICSHDLPILNQLSPPIHNRRPEGDALWIGADYDWTFVVPDQPIEFVWCAMISVNIACARRKGPYFDFVQRVCMASLRYSVVSVMLASEHERRVLVDTLEWATKRVSTRIYLHTISADRGPGGLALVGDGEDALTKVVERLQN
jgi:hypothetical protein